MKVLLLSLVFIFTATSAFAINRGPFAKNRYGELLSTFGAFQNDNRRPYVLEPDPAAVARELGPNHPSLTRRKWKVYHPSIRG